MDGDAAVRAHSAGARESREPRAARRSRCSRRCWSSRTTGSISMMRSLGGAWATRTVELHELTNFPITLAAYDGDELTSRSSSIGAGSTRTRSTRMLGHLRTSARRHRGRSADVRATPSVDDRGRASAADRGVQPAADAAREPVVAARWQRHPARALRSPGRHAHPTRWR